ncbi:MAG TPA: hypothetical protein VL992_03995, partial [Tepidisphaeraceae bacterium]|nr:hypothetical protein [Tepidisphaeraceae bacterium]
VMSVVDALDRPIPQVLIKALVAEVTHSNGDELGADLSAINLGTSTSGVNSASTAGVTGSTVSPAVPGLPIPTAPNPGVGLTNTVIQTSTGEVIGSTLGAAANASQSGGLVYSMLEKNVMATVQALEDQQKLDVLSRPYILTSDNQEATIVVGEEDPFISDTRVETTGQLVNTIQYQEIGVILDVTPHINPDGLVTMLVNPQVSENKNSPVQITNGVYSPVFTTRSASAQVAVKDGDTIVIGGMMEDQVGQTINKVPLLGDLPLIGVLFQNNQTTKTKTELLFFLTPHVVNIPQRLQDMSNAELHGLKLIPNSVERGDFQEHLKGLELGDQSGHPSRLYIPPIPTTQRATAPGEPPLPSDKD